MPNLLKFPPQVEVIEKIIQFKSIEQEKEMDDSEKSWLRRGLCFGISLVYAYESTQNSLVAYAAILDALVTWDGSQKSLKGNLTYQYQNLDRTENLKLLFRRIISYFMYYQGSAVEFTYPQINFLQEHFLSPNRLMFSEAPPLKQQNVVCAKFKVDLLKKLFLSLSQYKLDSNTLCIISNLPHACAFRLLKDAEGITHYIFYDPNDTQEKCYVEVEDFIQEITCVLGLELIITLSCWEKCDFSDFLITVRQLDFLQAAIESSVTFYMCARYSPTQLSYLIELSKTNEMILIALCKRLLEDDNGTGLSYLIQHAKSQVYSLIALAETNEEIENIWVSALPLVLKSGGTHINLLLKIAPDLLSPLLSLTKSKPRILKSLFSAISHTDTSLNTGLHYVATYAPNEFMTLLILANEYATPYSDFLKWCVLLNESGRTPLHALAYHRHIFFLYVLARTDVALNDTLAFCIQKQDDRGITLLELQTTKQQLDLALLFDFAQSHPNNTLAVSTSILCQNVVGQCFTHTLAYCMPQLFISLFSVWYSQNPCIQKALDKSLLIENKKHQTPVFVFLKFNNQYVKDLIPFLDANINLMSCFISKIPIILSETSKSLLNYIAQRHSDVLIPLFVLARKHPRLSKVLENILCNEKPYSGSILSCMVENYSELQWRELKKSCSFDLRFTLEQKLSENIKVCNKVEFALNVFNPFYKSLSFSFFQPFVSVYSSVKQNNESATESLRGPR